MVKNNNICMQIRKLSWNLEKEKHVQMMVAFHLEVLHRGFLSEEYDENYVENVDETHFMIIWIMGGHWIFVESKL